VTGILALGVTITSGALAADRRGLVVAPGAAEIAWHTTKGGASVEYFVQEEYPAARTLGFIQDSLRKTGWQPVRGPALGRSETSSIDSGWQDLPGEHTPRLIRIWSARWVDLRGNEVTYSLGYSSPLAESGLTPTHVGVAAWYLRKKDARRQRAWLEKQIHSFRGTLLEEDLRW
jgi:hypothetical protein